MNESNRTSSFGMAALCAGVAMLAGIASALGVFARGDRSDADAQHKHEG